jgi:hypothetical protein
MMWSALGLALLPAQRGDRFDEMMRATGKAISSAWVPSRVNPVSPFGPAAASLS